MLISKKHKKQRKENTTMWLCDFTPNDVIFMKYFRVL